MVDQIHLRIKNPETRDKFNYICKTRKISFNQLVNEILDDFVSKNDDKKELKAIDKKLIELDKKIDILIKLEQKNLLMSRKILEIMTKNHDKKMVERTKLSSNLKGSKPSIDDESIEKLLQILMQDSSKTINKSILKNGYERKNDSENKLSKGAYNNKKSNESDCFKDKIERAKKESCPVLEGLNQIILCFEVVDDE